MQAIHTVVTESGRFFQIRGSTEDEVRQILFVAKANLHENILDVVDEVRGGTEREEEEEKEEDYDETLPIETEYLKRGQDIIEIPQDVDKMRMIGIKVDVLAAKYKELVDHVEEQDSGKMPEDPISAEVELLDDSCLPVDVVLIEEKPKEEPEEYLEVDIRPLQNITAIVGVAETKDHSSLFDE